MPQATLRSWFRGRDYPTQAGRRSFPPILDLPDPKQLVLSYTNLIEAHVLRSMRFDHGIKLPKIRATVKTLQEKFGSQHPLAEHDFLTDNFNLLIGRFGRLVNVSRYGQMEFPEVVKVFLRRIERERGGLPIVFYPLPFYERVENVPEQPRPVAFNPVVAFGQPIIPGTGVKAEVLFDRWSAGETIADLSADYSIEPNKIEAAIQWYATSQRKAA